MAPIFEHRNAAYTKYVSIEAQKSGSLAKIVESKL